MCVVHETILAQQQRRIRPKGAPVLVDKALDRFEIHDRRMQDDRRVIDPWFASFIARCQFGEHLLGRPPSRLFLLSLDSFVCRRALRRKEFRVHLEVVAFCHGVVVQTP